jgi:DNA polymerase (family 10)
VGKVMIDNLRVAWILEEMGDLLKIKGANYFRVQSYYDVSRRIKDLDEDIDELAIKDRLQEIEGVGESLEDSINEILEEGTCVKYEELKSEIPVGLLKILDLPGVGPKKVKLFYEELGIDSLEALKDKASNRQLRKLSGIGAKTEFKILDAIKRTEDRDEKVNLGLATDLAEGLINLFNKLKDVNKVEVVVSLRRKDELIGDIDFLIATKNPDFIIDIIKEYPLVTGVITETKDQIELTSKLGINIEIFFVNEDEFFTSLLALTGKEEHYRRLSDLAVDKGYRLESSAIYSIDIGESEESEQVAGINSEEDIYKLLGLPYIIPEIRIGGSEIDLALNDELPEKVEIENIKGDLHLHTKWSDGGNTIKEMAVACQQRGYEYLAVCDHSKSLGIAGGLGVKELKEQMEEIDRANETLDDFRVLKGSEVDILNDGELDYPEEILSELDIVVASIHSGFNHSKKKMNKRILTAMENEFVNILAHPTGRLLAKRDSYAVDIEKVIEKAVETGTILEVNSSPKRLDLSAEHLRLAKEARAKIVINTDAHNIQQLDNVRFGVYNARKGWIEPFEVVNTYSLTKLLKLLN